MIFIIVSFAFDAVCDGSTVREHLLDHGCDQG